MSDDRLDRELGELFRAAADVQVPDRLAGRVASIPHRRSMGLRPSLSGVLRFGSLVVGGLIILALAWGLPRMAPAAGSGSPSFAPTHPTNVTTPTSRPCTTAIPTAAPRGTGPTPTPYPATPTPRSVGPTPALAPGSFEQTGSMAGARYGATATRLTDGRVLIVGGVGNDGALASAELYDPVTCRFLAAGSMPDARPGFSSTLLRDGRVLIAGGYDEKTNKIIASALVYDPATGMFTPTGSLELGRTGQYAVLLPDGRVLIAGGSVSIERLNGSVASAELYDPMTGTFSATGSMSTTRVGAAVALMPDGEVLFAGGTDGLGYTGTGHTGDLSSAELYDPATGTFRPTGSMLEGSGQTATVLNDGRVLVLAEVRNLPVGTLPVFRPSAELYDAKTGTFKMTASYPAPIWVGWPSPLDTALLPDGRVFFFSGTTCQLYDPVTGTFASTGPTALRSAPAVALLQDGTVLIAGGSQPVGDTPGAVLSTAEIFRP